MPASLWPITTFGLGLLRPAPGTWGSLPPAGLAMLLVLLGRGPASDGLLWYALLTATVALFSAACLACGNAAERHFRRKDPSQVVADETAGMALALLCLPHACFASPQRAAIWIGAAFVLFRLADILKPPPARRLQSLHAGAGILIDDLIAGVYAGVPCAAAAWLLL